MTAASRVEAQTIKESRLPMSLTPTLFFKGDAEEALELYRDALGGNVDIRRYSEAAGRENGTDGWDNKVMYGMLTSAHGIVAAMDAPPERAGDPGDNFAIAIQTSKDDTDGVFEKLSAGGSVTMPLQETFYSPRFGMLTDRFGVKWFVSAPYQT
jgi:PhnB protein